MANKQEWVLAKNGCYETLSKTNPSIMGEIGEQPPGQSWAGWGVYLNGIPVIGGTISDGGELSSKSEAALRCEDVMDIVERTIWAVKHGEVDDQE